MRSEADDTAQKRKIRKNYKQKPTSSGETVHCGHKSVNKQIGVRDFRYVGKFSYTHGSRATVSASALSIVVYGRHHNS